MIITTFSYYSRTWINIPSLSSRRFFFFLCSILTKKVDINLTIYRITGWIFQDQKRYKWVWHWRRCNCRIAFDQKLDDRAWPGRPGGGFTWRHILKAKWLWTKKDLQEMEDHKDQQWSWWWMLYFYMKGY